MELPITLTDIIYKDLMTHSNALVNLFPHMDILKVYDEP